jgi:hypothetical protein
MAEGDQMLLSQIVVAHEAALDMYRRAWSQPPEYFEARCRYIQMADKAQRTVAILTERLDRHRGAGQQSITGNRHVIIAWTARYRIPAIYFFRSFADSGGLMGQRPGRSRGGRSRRGGNTALRSFIRASPLVN